MECLSLKLTVLFMLTAGERSSDSLVDELPMLEYTIQSLYSRHLKVLWRLESETITEFRRKDPLKNPGWFLVTFVPKPFP